MHVTAIIAAGGVGRRLGAGVPKQLLEVGGRTILQRSVEAFSSHPRVDDVVVVLPPDVAADAPPWLVGQPSLRIVAGGERRQDSVAKGFRAIAQRNGVVLVHDAARPFVTAAVISRAIDAAVEHGAAIVAQPSADTVKRVRAGERSIEIVETVPRESIFLAQTPQAFQHRILGDAVALGEAGVTATDEAALAEQAGHTVHVVLGAADNVKITTAADLDAARRYIADAPAAAVHGRIGTGYDLHRLVAGRRLMIGGVEVPFALGAAGHSDADVVCHASTDALLGAASLADIGRHFPDTDASWKDAASLDLLRKAVDLVHHAGFRIVNLDVVVVLERPKIASFIDLMRGHLAAALEIPIGCVSVKGKTNEGVDAIGRGEAIAAHAVALIATR